ncbi:substrate-binding domain-containing protein [Roseibium sp.]|uniref:substrate-binding domain-containing protein n=1 Tax=Roseibium sp. TaxID=1936156 RepID=UPI003D104EFF
MKLLVKHLAASALIGLMSASAMAETVGPNGETATLSANVTVPEESVEAIRAANYKAALLWHDQSDFVNAVSAGAKDEFERLGIEVVATTSAGFDAAKQRSDIETTMAKQPNIILSLPLDPVTSAAAFKEARDSGVSLVFLSNLPAGYEHPRDYAAIVTDDLFQMGKQAADALAGAMGGKGTVGWIYHDADYYVTNQRDNAFKTTIENDYPEMSIVAEQGISDPARAEEIANAMLLKNPDLGGIYVTWAGPAEGVLAALRANGNKTTKIVTLDLSEPVALDMVRGGNVAAIVADEAYELGRAMAAAGALRLAGQEVPSFVAAPAITVTADTVAEGWKKSLNIDPPASVSSAN